MLVSCAVHPNLAGNLGIHKVPSSAADPSGLPRAAATLAVLTSVTCLQAIDRGLEATKVREDSRIPMVTPHPEAIDTSDIQ